MWCNSCQQDVPGVPAGEGSKYVCPRCGVAAPSAPALSSDAAPEQVDRPTRDRPQRLLRRANPIPADVHMSAVLDDWDLDERLLHIGRVLAVEPPCPTAAPVRTVRVDEPHVQAAPPPASRPWARDIFRKVEAAQAEGVLPLLTWLSLLVGTMAVVCGGILVAWAWIAGRPELWRIGQPIALGGVSILVVGLVLQVDQQWQQRRGGNRAAPTGESESLVPSVAAGSGAEAEAG